MTQEQLGELLVEAEELVESAEAAPTPAARIPLLERARTNLYRVMSFYRDFGEAAELANGRRVGSLQRDHLERLLREARMDVCRADPDYACIIESAYAAARATASDRMDLAYRTIALAQARVGDIRGALETARHIPGIDAGAGGSDGTGEFALYPRFDDPREVIVRMQVRTGDVEGARVTAERFGVDIPWQEVAYSALRRGDLPRAAEALAWGEAEAEQNSDGTELLFAFAEVASAWARLGHPERAADAASRAEAAAERTAPEERPSALAEAATVWAAIGEAARARDVASRVLALVRESEPPGSLAFRDPQAAALAWAAIGEIELAREITDYVRGFGTVWRRGIADALLDRGEGEAALTFLDGFFATEAAIARARSGDTEGALTLVDSDRRLRLEDSSCLRDYRRLTPRVAIASAQFEAGEVAAARETLGVVTGEIARNRECLAAGEDHSNFYETAGMMVDVASLLNRVGEVEEARDMLAEAITEAAKIEEWDFFDPARPEDPGTFGVYGSGTDDATSASNPLSEHYAYVRGVGFQRVLCTAIDAGLPVSRETLRQDVVPAGRTRDRRYHVRTWTMAAVAMALVNGPCPDQAEMPRE